MVCFHSRRAPVSAEFSDNSSSVQKELAQCLLPGGIRNKDPNPHGAFEYVSLESHRRVGRLLIAARGGYAFYAMVLRDYYL